jgi:hypothetical protein
MSAKVLESAKTLLGEDENSRCMCERPERYPCPFELSAPWFGNLSDQLEPAIEASQDLQSAIPKNQMLVCALLVSVPVHSQSISSFTSLIVIAAETTPAHFDVSTRLASAKSSQ